MWSHVRLRIIASGEACLLPICKLSNWIACCFLIEYGWFNHSGYWPLLLVKRSLIADTSSPWCPKDGNAPVRKLLAYNGPLFDWLNDGDFCLITHTSVGSAVADTETCPISDLPFTPLPLASWFSYTSVLTGIWWHAYTMLCTTYTTGHICLLLLHGLDISV